MTRVGAKGREAGGNDGPALPGGAPLDDISDRRQSRDRCEASPHVAHAWRARHREAGNRHEPRFQNAHASVRAARARWAARTVRRGRDDGSPGGNGNAGCGFRTLPPRAEERVAPRRRRGGVREEELVARRGVRGASEGGTGRGRRRGRERGRGRGRRADAPRGRGKPAPHPVDVNGDGAAVAKGFRVEPKGDAEEENGEADAPNVVAAPGTEKTMTRGRGEGGAREVGATGNGARKSRRGRFILSQGVRSSSRSNPDTWQKKEICFLHNAGAKCRKPAPPAPANLAPTPPVPLTVGPRLRAGPAARFSLLARCRAPSRASRASTRTPPRRL